MRRRLAFRLGRPLLGGATGLVLLGSAGCVPAAAAPFAAVPETIAAQQRESIAVPTEDGSLYVLIEGGPRMPHGQMVRAFRRKAERTCQGEYMTLSQSASMRRSGGIVARKIYEGFVRCVSPEFDEAEITTPSEGAPAVAAPPELTR